MCNCNNRCNHGRRYGFTNFLGDVIMTICTFGLWLIWVLVREISN